MAIKLLISVLFVSLSTLAAPKTACKYQFDSDNVTIEATGYKFTEKLGVTGQFTGFSINKNEAKPKVSQLFDGLIVTVDLMTLDSGNSLRDKNMRETLFAHVVGDSKVTVAVQSATDKKINATFNLNDKTEPIAFQYTVVKDVVKAVGVIDFAQFALGDQLSALRKRCGSLHTGPDGKSVTWTDFALSVTAPLKKVCK